MRGAGTSPDSGAAEFHVVRRTTRWACRLGEGRPRHPAAAAEEDRIALKKTADHGGRGAARVSGRGARDLGDGRTPHRFEADHARRVAPIGKRPIALGHHRFEWLYVTGSW